MYSTSCMEYISSLILVLLFYRYAKLFGVGVRENLLGKALEIMNNHSDIEINRQASKLYEALS